MPAPQFVVMHRDEEGAENRPGDSGTGAAQDGNEQEQGARIESLVNNLLRSFMDVFNGREFLRM